MLTSEEINAIAETLPKTVHDGTKARVDKKETEATSREQISSATNPVPHMSFASIGLDGKVRIEAVEDSKPK